VVQVAVRAAVRLAVPSKTLSATKLTRPVGKAPVPVTVAVKAIAASTCAELGGRGGENHAQGKRRGDAGARVDIPGVGYRNGMGAGRQQGIEDGRTILRQRSQPERGDKPVEGIRKDDRAGGDARALRSLDRGSERNRYPSDCRVGVGKPLRGGLDLDHGLRER